MAKKTTKQRIREQVKADQARYDEVTRRFEAWLARKRGSSAASETEAERYDRVTRELQDAIDRYRRRADEQRSRS